MVRRHKFNKVSLSPQQMRQLERKKEQRDRGRRDDASEGTHPTTPRAVLYTLAGFGNGRGGFVAEVPPWCGGLVGCQ